MSKLILFATFARTHWAPDYPFGTTPEELAARATLIRDAWASGHITASFTPDITDELLDTLARFERGSCTPQLVEEIMLANGELDVRDALGSIAMPTLVIHSSGDPIINVENGRYLAKHIRKSSYVEIEENSHVNWANLKHVAGHVRRFIEKGSSEPRPQRRMATVLFTDIVASTQTAAQVGDSSYRVLLDHHDKISADRIRRHDGQLIRSTGDGVLATFDGPARAISCAQAVRDGLREHDVALRAGLHTGEIESRGDDITGLSVAIARRVCDLASAGEVLATRTVKDLVLGSEIRFADRGHHTLKGVPEDWDLFAVEG